MKTGEGTAMPRQMVDSAGRLMTTQQTQDALVAFRRKVAGMESHYDVEAVRRCERKECTCKGRQ